MKKKYIIGYRPEGVYIYPQVELSKRAGPYGPARLARLILGLGP